MLGDALPVLFSALGFVWSAAFCGLQIGGLCFSTVLMAVGWILTVNGEVRGINWIRRSVMSCRRVVRSPQDSKGMPRCCMCGDSGRRVRCACVQAGVMCSSCLPSRRGHCCNPSPAIECPDAVASGVGGQTSSRDDNGSGCDTGINNSVTVINERFQHAFGASLLHSEGDCYEDSWCKLWLRLVAFTNCHYDLPNGSVGKDFVALLSSETDLLAQGSVQSERVLVFFSAMLQHDPMVQRGTDIHRLLAC